MSNLDIFRDAKNRDFIVDPAMSLRDEFAKAALQGMLAGEPGSHLFPHTCAARAYGYADAMLKERAK